jgi:hypothetical protein
MSETDGSCQPKASQVTPNTLKTRLLSTLGGMLWELGYGDHWEAQKKLFNIEDNHPEFTTALDQVISTFMAEFPQKNR